MSDLGGCYYVDPAEQNEIAMRLNPIKKKTPAWNAHGCPGVSGLERRQGRTGLCRRGRMAHFAVILVYGRDLSADIRLMDGLCIQQVCHLRQLSTIKMLACSRDGHGSAGHFKPTFRNPDVQLGSVESCHDFLNTFVAKARPKHNIVISVNGLSGVYGADEHVWNQCFRTF
jgi:hypothetical protein